MIDADKIYHPGHQLHPLLRRRLLQIPRHNLQRLPHPTHHDPRKRLLHPRIFLHRREIRPSQDPDRGGQFHGHFAIHRWGDWDHVGEIRGYGSWESECEGDDCVYLLEYFGLCYDLGSFGVDCGGGDFPVADSFERGWVVYC